MTLSQEHIDQMLSGYLDDALTPEQHAEVQRWLDRDPTINRQWTDLCELRDSLRSIADSDRSVKLDSGFSGRVLEAAVARARAEGLAEDHPLVRVSEQPTSIRADRRSLSWSKIAGVVVGIAASLAFAVMMLSPDPSPQSSPTNAPNSLAAISSSETHLNAPESSSEPSSESIVRQSSDVQSGDVQSGDVQSGDVQSGDPKSSMSEIASAVAITIDEDSSSVIPLVDSAPVTNAIAAVLVLDVRQTQKGRAMGAVRRAMRSSAIDRDNQKSVNVDIATAATDSAEIASDEKVSLFYLQAPAKSLDRFYLTLMADREGVASVGMTIAMDAPVLKVVNSIDPNPTTVRHQGAVLLPGNLDSTRTLASQLSELNFLPLDPALVGGVSVDSGPDINSQVLVLVH